MKRLHIVDPNNVHWMWDAISDYFQRSYEQSSSDCTPDQLRMILSRGGQILFLVMEEDQIIGAFSVEVLNQPNSKTAVTTAMGGRGVLTEETISQYEEWAKSQGVTKIRAYAKESQARLYRQKLGLIPTAYVVEKEL
jgi:hypothetical protein